MVEHRHAALQWVRHWLRCVGSHSIHSPHLYRFVHEVLLKKDDRTVSEAEAFRSKLLLDQRIVGSEDHGSGSSVRSGRSLAKVVKNEVASPLMASVYRRIVEFQQASRVLEIGTSVGITTLWISSDPSVEVVTLEANADLLETATRLFQTAKRNNIRLIPGNADETLTSVLKQGWVPDVAIVDANHRLNPTISYFKQLAEAMDGQGILLLDDIHYSREMTRAWEHISNDRQVTLALDCFRFGIVFFDRKLNKETIFLEVPFNLLR